MVLGALSSLAIILLMKRELVALFELFCGCVCSMSLRRCAVGLSAVCDCTWSYSLTFMCHIRLYYQYLSYFNTIKEHIPIINSRTGHVWGN